MDRKLFFSFFRSPAEEGDVTYLFRPQNNETKRKKLYAGSFCQGPCDVEYTFIAKPYFQASHDAAKLNGRRRRQSAAPAPRDDESCDHRKKK